MAVTIKNTFRDDVAGQESVITEMAQGLADWCHLTTDRIKALAPPGPSGGSGVHSRGGPQYKGVARRTVVGHYNQTIDSATYLKGKIIDGTGAQATGFDPIAGSDLHSIIFSSSPLAHLLELTGAKPHDIPGNVQGLTTVSGYSFVVHHPGFERKPHFIPGLLASAADVGAQMKGKVRA